MYPGPRAAGTHDPSSWHRTVQVCPHRSGGLKAELRVLTGGLLEALLEKPCPWTRGHRAPVCLVPVPVSAFPSFRGDPVFGLGSALL